MSKVVDSQINDYIYRHFITPGHANDVYSLYVVRYDLARNRYGEDGCAFLTPTSEWVSYESGTELTPFCTWDGRKLNPYVGTKDWRDAVADVINDEITPLIESLIISMHVAAERNPIWTVPVNQTNRI